MSMCRLFEDSLLKALLLSIPVAFLLLWSPVFAKCRGDLELGEINNKLGGISIGKPIRKVNGHVYVPVRVSVRGEFITAKPTAGYSAKIITKICSSVVGSKISISICTGLFGRGTPDGPGFVDVGKIPGGHYRVVYISPKEGEQSLAEVDVP